LYGHWINKESVQILGLFLLVLTVRVIAFLFSKNHAYDSVDRIILAQKWLERPFLMTDASLTQQHTVMPIYLIGIAMGIWNDPLITPRLVNLVIGSLTTIPFFLLVKSIFDRRTAIYSTLFFSFFTLHVRSSVIASSEAPFIFFLLFCLFFFFKFKGSEKTSDLVYSAILLNFACMTRYNGWIYIPLLCLLLPRSVRDLKNTFLLRSKTTYQLLIFGGISAVFPISWMIGNTVTFGDPLYPIHITENYTMWWIKHHALSLNSLMEILGFRLYYLTFWPAVVFLSVTPIIASFLFFGLGHRIYKREQLGIILLIGGITLWFAYKILTKTFVLMPRFTIDSSIIALPFAVVGIDQFLFQFGRKWRRPLTGLIALSVVASLFFIVWTSEKNVTILGANLSQVSPISTLTPIQKDIISFIDRNTDPDDKVVLDHDTQWAEKEIMFYSDLDIERFITGAFLRTLKKERPKYVIGNANGHLPDIQDVWAEEDMKGKDVRFKLVHRAAPYLIYQTTYSDSDQNPDGRSKNGQK
jgi:hypothetical protein